MVKKLKRNDKCHCGSGKKYKTCHLEKDDTERKENNERLNSIFEDGHEISDELLDLYEFLKNEYKKFKIIDVTNVLTSTSYRPIQTKHFYADTIIIARRTEENNEVFQTRGDSTTDWIVMFRGAHQVFNRYSFGNMKKQLKEMIAIRLKGDDYDY